MTLSSCVCSDTASSFCTSFHSQCAAIELSSSGLTKISAELESCWAALGAGLLLGVPPTAIFCIPCATASTSACTGMEKAMFAIDDSCWSELPAFVRPRRSELWARARERREEYADLRFSARAWSSGSSIGRFGGAVGGSSV